MNMFEPRSKEMIKPRCSILALDAVDRNTAILVGPAMNRPDGSPVGTRADKHVHLIRLQTNEPND